MGKHRSSSYPDRCNRPAVSLCEAGAAMWWKVHRSFYHAVRSGDWAEFERDKYTLEEHFHECAGAPE